MEGGASARHAQEAENAMFASYMRVTRHCLRAGMLADADGWSSTTAHRRQPAAPLQHASSRHAASLRETM